MNDIKIATVEDFKKKFQERQNGEAEPVTLPSGLSVMARRPKPDWWLRHMGQLPTSMAAQLSGTAEVISQLSIQELVEYSRWAVQLVQEIVLSPVIRINPGPDEVDPDWISDEDLRFLIKYAGGEVSADNTSLEVFP